MPTQSSVACNLPTEILSYIFALVRDAWPPTRTDPPDEGGQTYDLGCIYITHVCGLWRKVALGTPTLWTNIDACLDIPLGLVPSILKRSGRLPLSLTFSLPNDEERRRTPDIQTILSTWLTDTVCSRLLSLTLEWFDRVEIDHVRPYLIRCMESLERFIFTASNLSDNTGGATQLPLDVCNSIKGSQLRELCLDDLMPVWEPATFCTTLTVLELHSYTGIPNPMLPTFQQLADALTSLRSLERLSLSDMFPDSEDLPSHDHYFSRIGLQPGFKELEIATYDAVESALDLLSHLVLPPSCTCHVEICDAEGIPVGSARQDVFTALVITLYHIRGVEHPPVKLIIDANMILLCQSEHAHPARCTADLSMSQDAYCLQPGDTQLHVLNGASSESANPTRGIFATPLQSLRAIGIQDGALQSIVHDDILSGLTAACGVRRLDIELLDSKAFLLELTKRVHGGYHIFPLLEIIHFHRGHHGGASKVETENLETECDADVFALVDLAKDRKKKGAPLREVSVEKVFAEWNAWDAVRSYVSVTVLDS
ncbi:unnamed protein product [Peniophora sp. CBMAI 1063]|nr:unnamed protein product [Peniophora sp. CBMAI 1063]